MGTSVSSSGYTASPASWESSREWPRALGSFTHMGDPQDPGSLLQSTQLGSAPAVCTVNQQMERFVSFSLWIYFYNNHLLLWMINFSNFLLAAALSTIFWSMVFAVTRRYTTTGFVWPILWHLSWAWRSDWGFLKVKKKYFVSLIVRAKSTYMIWSETLKYCLRST